jgi:GNAT superfamily N-acetyltransferase
MPRYLACGCPTIPHFYTYFNAYMVLRIPLSTDESKNWPSIYPPTIYACREILIPKSFPDIAELTVSFTLTPHLINLHLPHKHVLTSSIQHNTPLLTHPRLKLPYKSIKKLNMTFKVSVATPADVPGILDVHYAGWTDPKALRIFPNTDSVRDFLSRSMIRCIEGRDGGGSTLLVCRDDEGKAVGWARWYFEKGAEGGDMAKKRNGVTTWWERWVGDKDGKLGEGMTEEIFGGEFMEPMQRQHEVVMKGRPHYCTSFYFPFFAPPSLLIPILTLPVLESLATHPDFRKKGIAAQMVSWGTEKADQLGVEMYLDASRMGLPLYEKHGWVALRESQDEKCVSMPMLRPKRGDV